MIEQALELVVGAVDGYKNIAVHFPPGYLEAYIVCSAVVASSALLCIAFVFIFIMFSKKGGV